MSALAFAIRWTPTARATESVAGMPSGTSATMTPRANNRPSTMPNLKTNRAMKNSRTPQINAMIETVRAILSISRISGDLSSETPAVRSRCGRTPS